MRVEFETVNMKCAQDTGSIKSFIKIDLAKRYTQINNLDPFTVVSAHGRSPENYTRTVLVSSIFYLKHFHFIFLTSIISLDILQLLNNSKL